MRPGGIASLIMMNLRVAAYGQARVRSAAAPTLAVAPRWCVAARAPAAMIEMVYHLQLNDTARPRTVEFLGVRTRTRAALDSWFGAVHRCWPWAWRCSSRCGGASCARLVAIQPWTSSASSAGSAP
jgi:hypothetical protein